MKIIILLVDPKKIRTRALLYYDNGLFLFFGDL